MKEIPLSRGKVTLVDDQDYEWLCRWRWFYLEPTPGYGGYAVRNTWDVSTKKAGREYMHRTIMNPHKGQKIDHRDGDGLNNRRSNLRACTHGENLRNQRVRKDNSSGYRGVDRSFGKWRARIRVNGREIHLGYFVDKDDAARAWNRAARKYHGKFARLNVIDSDLALAA